MGYNIIKETRKLMMESSVSKIKSKEEISKILDNTQLFSTEKAFYEKYGDIDFKYYYNELEGFNREEKIYLNPTYATPHSIIHHAMHILSRKYDEKGNIKAEGIQYNMKSWNEKMLNEGLTEYLTSKISGEERRVYKEEKYFFEKLGEITKKRYNEDYLMEIYLNNKQKELRRFIKEYGGKEIEEEIFEKAGIIGKKEIDKSIKKISKKVDRKIRQEKIIEDFKKIFRIDDKKRLEEKNYQLKSNTSENNKYEYLNSLKIEKEIKKVAKINKSIITKEEVER